ncbi:MAG: hypothetical protein RMJ43_02220 [Chloroherpetonaceae bacterium]|nr:hypothetical protein [Chthonomonadaceae bacterium]MDW8206624.1 hypothetical protein [Chloroherpetonaceae bacterium]
MSSTLQGVAPADLLRMDFKILDDRDTLRTTWPNEQLILMQSVVGRAHEGHGAFNRRRFPNTSPDDVARALRLDPYAVRQARQRLIDDIAWYVDRTLSGYPPQHLLNADNEPLLGMSTLRFFQVDATDVLAGIYLGGLRDDVQVRRELRERTGVPIGGGKSYLVDRKRLEAMGIDGEQLAHGEWGERMEELREKGVIVGAERQDDPDVSYEYIRHMRGLGASDDAAIVAAGLRWGLGVGIGMFLADVIDTIEKYVPVYSDQDLALASQIEQRCGDLNRNREDALLLTLWAVAEDEDDYRVPDSSLRHMLTIDRRCDLCPIESHLLTVMGAPCPDIGLGHERSSSCQFYAWVRRRMERYPTLSS